MEFPTGPTSPTEKPKTEVSFLWILHSMKIWYTELPNFAMLLWKKPSMDAETEHLWLFGFF